MSFFNDFRYGIYPLTAYALATPPPARTRAVTPEGPNESAQSVTPEPLGIINNNSSKYGNYIYHQLFLTTSRNFSKLYRTRGSLGYRI